MTLAHVMGVPVEESVLALAPAATALLGVAAASVRARLARITRRAAGASPPGSGARRPPARGA